MGEDAGDGFIDFGEPNRACSEDFLDGEIEPAVTREQRPDTQRRGAVGEGLVGRGRTSWNGDPRSRVAAPSWSPTRCTNHSTRSRPADASQVARTAVDKHRLRPSCGSLERVVTRLASEARHRPKVTSEVTAPRAAELTFGVRRGGGW